MTQDASVYGLVPLVIGSLAYFCLHSLLASIRAKRFIARRHPGFMPYYRLAFNGLSGILLLPLVWFIHQHPGPLLWAWPGYWRWLSLALTLLAAGGLVWSSRGYDLAVFVGIRQWREGWRQLGEPGTLHISTLHRFVRHPWYFLILVILWSQDQHFNQTIFYALATAYLIVGSRLEERKLVHQYGDAYRLYKQKVPGLFPLPWRWLQRTEAEALAARARDDQTPAI